MPWNDVFSLPVKACAAEIAEWLRAGIEEFIPHKRYQVKPHSAPWFSPECSAAIANKNHHYHCYRRNSNSSNRNSFKKARNYCRKVLDSAKSSYKESTKRKIADQQLGSKDFWKIINSVLNKSKSNIPPLINGPEILQSSRDKAELLARIFSMNFNLNSATKSVPEFAKRTSSILDKMKITPTSTASGPDHIPVIVLKKLSPELSPVLSQLFSKCLDQMAFPECWKSATVIPAFKNCGDRTDPR